MLSNKRLFLIGPMGAGKTSVGLELSRLLGFRFTDTDQLLTLQLQASSRQIIDKYGELFWRKHEAAALAKAFNSHSEIIATGGGCVLLEENRSLLKRCANVYYLQVRPTTQVTRLATCTERGLLPDDPKQRIAFFNTMAEQRKHLYASIATHTIDTDEQTIAQISTQIADLYHA